MNQSLPKKENLSLGFFYQLNTLEQTIRHLKGSLQYIAQHTGYRQFLETEHLNALDQMWELVLNLEDQENTFRQQITEHIPPYPLRVQQSTRTDIAPRYHRLILEEDEFVGEFLKELSEGESIIYDPNEPDNLDKQLRAVKNNLQVREEYLKGFFKEIEDTKNEFALQEVDLEEAFNQMDDDYTHIKNGVDYALRFQKAILPKAEAIQEVFTDCFILHKPKNIVSGDFYWLHQLDEDRYLLGCFDCTGHGVPGAFMSLLGHDQLNEIVHRQKIQSPEKILETLHLKIRDFLRQPENNNRDGMDAAICLIDHKNKTLEYAGAHNPLLYIQAGNFHLIKADPCAIGGYEKEGKRIFTKHTISIEQHTKLYLFSDGYQDQIGGPNARRFMASRLYRLLFEVQHKPMDKQQRILEKIIDHWMKSRTQLDDILIIGVEV
ncbi:MAG: SpoIIE family protein phosphatase [Microscillaceae bacterium]|nr:SpoIIE family protein phosphatase [Microscillaceae bacterium]